MKNRLAVIARRNDEAILSYRLLRGNTPLALTELVVVIKTDIYLDQNINGNQQKTHTLRTAEHYTGGY